MSVGCKIPAGWQGNTPQLDDDLAKSLGRHTPRRTAANDMATALTSSTFVGRRVAARQATRPRAASRLVVRAEEGGKIAKVRSAPAAR